MHGTRRHLVDGGYKQGAKGARTVARHAIQGVVGARSPGYVSHALRVMALSLTSTPRGMCPRDACFRMGRIQWCFEETAEFSLSVTAACLITDTPRVIEVRVLSMMARCAADMAVRGRWWAYGDRCVALSC